MLVLYHRFRLLQGHPTNNHLVVLVSKREMYPAWLAPTEFGGVDGEGERRREHDEEEATHHLAAEVSGAPRISPRRD